MLVELAQIHSSSYSLLSTCNFLDQCKNLQAKLIRIPHLMINFSMHTLQLSQIGFKTFLSNIYISFFLRKIKWCTQCNNLRKLYPFSQQACLHAKFIGRCHYTNLIVDFLAHLLSNDGVNEAHTLLIHLNYIIHEQILHF